MTWVLQWEHRQGLKGLRYVCAALSKPAPNMTADEAGFVRVAHSGTFYTNDIFVHSRVVPDDKCKFCGLTDWEATRFSREMIPTTIRQALQQALPCLLEHGFAVEGEATRQLKATLHAIPDTPPTTLTWFAMVLVWIPPRQ